MYTILVECWAGALSFYTCTSWCHVILQGHKGHINLFAPKLPKCGKGLSQCTPVPKAWEYQNERYSDSFIVPGLCYASKTDYKIIYMGEWMEGVLSCNFGLKLKVIYKDTDLGL